MDIRIDRRAAIDTIIVGLAKRLREIQATEDELVYTVTEVLQGVLKVTDTWEISKAAKYLSVLRKADVAAMEDIASSKGVEPAAPCKCCCKFEIKDGDKVESFKELEQRYLRQYLTPYYRPTIVDSPINEDRNDSNAEAD